MKDADSCNAHYWTQNLLQLSRATPKDGEKHRLGINMSVESPLSVRTSVKGYVMEHNRSNEWCT